MRRVLDARREIRAQIKSSYDKRSGKYHYIVNKNGALVRKGKFYEADFLNYSKIDKNTIKREYHKKSREMVARLVRWVNVKISNDKRTNDSNYSADPGEEKREPYHLTIALERDAIAEKFGILEIDLSEALQDKRQVEQKMNDILKELEKTRDNVTSLTNLLLKIGADHGTNDSSPK